MARRGVVSGDTVRVLHVDADSDVTERLADALEGHADCFEVVAETDPQNALERLETAEFDCLVSGYDLAGMTGLELLEAVRAKDSEIPFILFTGSGDETVASRAISAGVTDYIRKESTQEGLSALVERVRRVADGGQGVSETDRYDREQLEGFLHAFPDTVLVVDEDGQYRDVIVGGDPSLLYDDVDELLGQRWHDVLPTEKADRFLETVREALATGEQQRIEYQLDVKQGKRWFEARVGPLETQSERRTVFWIARDITERKRREQEYEQIFNNVHDIIAVRDPETGELVDVNKPYAELLGYDREEMRGMQISDVGVTDEGYDDDRGMEYIGEVMASDEPVEVEWKIEDADGRTHVMDVRGTAGSITGEDRYLAIGRDITERKRRERAIETLQVATERLQTAETPADVASIAVETASDILDLPMAVCWFHDADADRLEPVTATDPAHEAGLVSGIPADRDEYGVFVDGNVTEYTPSEEAADNPLETGVLLPLADHGLIAAGAREEVRADGSILDVAKALADHVATALNRVERAQAVRESERRFRLIAERIDEVIYLAEPDFSEVLYVNPAYESIWGRPIDDLYDDAREFIEAIDGRDRATFEEEFGTMIEEMKAGEPDENYEFEFRVRQPDGEVRWVNANGHAVELPGSKRRFVGVAEDITERKRREQRLQVFNRILRHNLRNQLDVIRSHAEVLAERTEKGHADRILTSVDELASIGAQARNTDRIMSAEEQPAEIDIDDVLREVVEANEPTRRDVTVRTDIPAKTVLTRREALEIAVESALENAIEHASAAVTVAVEDGPEGCVITIEDDGPGIPEEELVPIEAGTETNLQHGRGLGLWQLRWSVDKLNGELSFETTGGTTVHITVPDQRESHDTD
ncbi:MAG: PAS domain S-box protein [Halovenus sp.]